jgi:hypothetical protein
MTQFLIRLYALLLHLYPRQFYTAYGQEMQSVFTEVITHESGLKSASLFLHEFIDLPGSLIRIYANQWFRGGGMTVKNEYYLPSTRWQAFIGSLPFLAFGIVSMIDKMDHVNPFRDLYLYLTFCFLVAVGLLIGWIRGFPLWSYSYLGWSVFILWIGSSGRINRISLAPPIMLMFGIMVLVALLWTRSLNPIKNLFREIWNDWTRLSLFMYTFIAFVFLIYDENHHPYLLIFMAASTLAVSAGAWFFFRSSHLIGRIVSIFGGFISSNVIGQICESTWDAQAYYNLPEGTPSPWYITIFRAAMIFSFLAAILLWPAIISLFHRLIARFLNQTKSSLE